jgi:hypothetical protein
VRSVADEDRAAFDPGLERGKVAQLPYTDVFARTWLRESLEPTAGVERTYARRSFHTGA